MNTLCDKVIASPEPGLRAACVQRSRGRTEGRGRRRREVRGGGGGGGADELQAGGRIQWQHVVFQLPMYSCRDAFAIAVNSHKFGSTGYI